MKQRWRRSVSVLLALAMLCSAMSGIGAPCVSAEENVCVAESVELLPAMESGNKWTNYEGSKDATGQAYINVPLTVPDGQRYAIRDKVTWESGVVPFSKGTYQFKGISWEVADSTVVELEPYPAAGSEDYAGYGGPTPNTNPTSCVYLTPKKTGTTTLTWRSLDSEGVTGTVTVNVVEALPTAITADNVVRLAKVGDTASISNIAVTPASVPAGYVFTTTSSAVQVDATGRITALAEGEADINVYSKYTNRTGSSSDKRVKVKAIVGPAAVEALARAHRKESFTKTIAAGETAVMPYAWYIYTVSEKEYSAQATDFTYTSNNPSVATVDEDGIITGLAGGTAELTATAKRRPSTGDLVSFTYAVTVIGNAPVVPTEVKVTGVSLNKTNTILRVAGTETLQATVTPSNATNRALTWTSSRPDVATVSDIGFVTAKMAGTAVITATAQDGSGVSASCTVTVTNEANGFTLSPTTMLLDLGIENQKQMQITATVEPAGADKPTLIWRSANESVATVDDDGLVTAVGDGTTTISAIWNRGTGVMTTKKCAVTVQTTINGIALSEANLRLKKQEKKTIQAYLLPGKQLDTTLMPVSANTGIATVTAGEAGYEIQGISAGTTVITFTSTKNSNLSAQCSVTVEPTKTTGITLNVSGKKTMTVGDTFRLQASILPEDADDKTVQWESRNPDVVAVDADGNLTAKAAGETTVIVSPNDGGAAAVSLTVSVTAKPVTAIVVSAASNQTSLKMGENVQLSAAVTPLDAGNRNVLWTSAREDLIVVDAQGKASVVGNVTAAQTVTITAAAADGSGVWDTITLTVVPTPLESFTITGGEVVKGETLALHAGQFMPQTASVQTVSGWSSSNPSVASVSKAGVVTANAVGETVITAQCDGVTATSRVKVVASGVAVTAISVDKQAVNVVVGETFTIEAAVVPSDATNQTLNWSVQNLTGSLIKQNGTDDKKVTFTASKVGTAEISIVSASNSSVTKTIPVTITAKPVTGIAITASTTGTLRKGSQCQLTATVTPEDATNSAVTWQSADESLATVDDKGLVKIVGDKETETSVAICATAADGSGVSNTYTITIAAQLATTVPVSAVTIIGDTSRTVEEGAAAFTIAASIAPDNATNQAVVWSVQSETGSATIAADGHSCTVTPGKPGTASIRVQAKSNPNVYAVFVLCVTKQNVQVHTHSYTEATVLQQATCTQPEITRRYCACGEAGAYQDAETAPAFGHAYVDVVVAPTTAAQGYTHHVCSRCQDAYDDTYVPSLSVDMPDVPGASATENEPTTASTTTTEQPAKITVKRAVFKKAVVKKNQVTIKWKKDKTVSGYEITVATDKKFKKNKKKVTVKRAKTTTVKIKKLKKNKKYYVRIRSYKVVKGRKVYGKYSKVTTFRTKK